MKFIADNSFYENLLKKKNNWCMYFINILLIKLMQILFYATIIGFEIVILFGIPFVKATFCAYLVYSLHIYYLCVHIYFFCLMTVFYKCQNRYVC